MPRPANPDAPKVPTTPEEAIEQGKFDMSDVPMDREANQLVAEKIEQANALLEEKKDVLARIGDVRELLTLLVNTGTGSYEQVAWIRFYLPRKTRKDGADEMPDTENGADVESDDVEAAA